MSLDIRTTVMIAAVLSLIVGVSLRYVLRDYTAAFSSSLRLWVLGTLLLPAGWLLYVLRDSIPDLFSIVVANGLLGLGYAKQVEGIRRFMGRDDRAGVIYAPVAAIVSCELIFTYLAPSMRLRGVSVSAIICVQLASAVVALVLHEEPARRGRNLTAAAFGVFALVLGVRAFYEGLRAGSLFAPFAPSPMQTVVFSVGATFPVAATIGFLLMCNDRLYQELLHQASIDALTGVSNRRTLAGQAALAIDAARRREQELAVLLIDADHFKAINDEFGHATGDAALQVIAAVLQGGVRASDLFGRLGGEEFAAVLPRSDSAAARRIAEQLRAAIERTPFGADGHAVPLRVSIGIAALEPGDDFATLLRRADQALYAAKRDGRNRVSGPLRAAPGASAIETA